MLPTKEGRLAGLQEWSKEQETGDADPRDPRIQDRELREAVEELQRERVRLLGSPPSRSDVADGIHRMIDGKHEYLKSRFGPHALSYFGGRLKVKGGSDGKSFIQVPPRIPDDLLGIGGLSSFTPFDVLCLLMPDQVKAGLEATLPATWDAGPSFSERRLRLAEIDTQITAHEETHAALVEAAAALSPPVVLALLESVRRERELTARR